MKTSAWSWRKGEEPAVGFAVRFILTFDEMVSALCAGNRHRSDDELLDVSASEVAKQVREALNGFGWEGLIYWADNIEDEEAERLRQWARRQVERAYGRG